MDVFATIREDARTEELMRLLAGGARAVAAEGLWGSSAPILAAIAAERLGRPLLLITAHADEADDTRDEIETALGSPPELLPQLDTLPQDAPPTDELLGERLRLCVGLLSEGSRDRGGKGSRDQGIEGSRGLGAGVIIAPVMALMQPVPSAEAIKARSVTLTVGDTLDVDLLANWLVDHGFQRCDAVEVPGDFARRGGILDIYSNGQTDPVRVEFFGDEVSSIRLFETGTQRSSHALDSVQIPALRFSGSEMSTGATTSFLAHLPPDTLIAFSEPAEIQELGRTFLQRLGERAGVIPVEAIFRRANDFTQLHLHRFTGVVPDAVRFDVSSLPQFEPKSTDTLPALAELAAEHEVVVLCDNPPEAQRFRELLDQQPPALPGKGPGEGKDGTEREAQPDGSTPRWSPPIGGDGWWPLPP